MASAYEVIYLTGAPAAGKSTLSRALAEAVRPLAVFEYGARLTAYVAARAGRAMAQEELRAESSAVATADDVQALDRVLLKFVADERERGHVLVDTHAVTKESYGFRITAYSRAGIAELRPTMIVVLYTAPEVAVARIAADAGGRPQITAWEAGFHTSLQASVAVAYATELGAPVYLLDGARPPEDLVAEIARRVGRSATTGEAASGTADVDPPGAAVVTADEGSA